MVDVDGIRNAAISFGGFVIAVSLVAILLDAINQTSLVEPHAVNTTNPVGAIVGNGTTLVGSLVLTWGSIIVLGIIIVFVFVGILTALQFLSGRVRGQR